MRRILSLLAAVSLSLLCLLLLGGCAFLNPPVGGTTPAPNTPTEPGGTGDYDLLLRYDDRLTLEGRFLRLESDNAALVSASNKSEGTFSIRATGVGDGILHIARGGKSMTLRVRVSPSPLHVLLVLGEGAAAGNADAAATPRAADGLVYYTTPGPTQISGLANPGVAAAYIPASLSSPKTSVAGNSLPIPLGELTTSGSGRYAGIAAPIAYQYAEATGDRVWVINLAEKSASITDYCPNREKPSSSPAIYRGALNLFEEAARVLEAELASGHYILEDFGFFYFGGEADAEMSEDAYYDAFCQMKRALEQDFTLPGEKNMRRGLAFGGVILPRAGAAPGPSMTEENGVRRALRRIDAEESAPLGNVHLVTTAIDEWDTDAHTALYFSQYDYRNFTLYYGYAPPKTTAELFREDGSYTAAACNELGYAAVRGLRALMKTP